MKERFVASLVRSTIPWEKRPFIPAGAGRIVCKVQGDMFMLQEDGHHAPRPILKCHVTLRGEQCEITWSEAPQIWFKIYFAIWLSVLWFMVLSSYFGKAGTLISKAPMLDFLFIVLMSGLGYGIVSVNDYLAHKRARKLGEFVRRISLEVSYQAQIQ